ncbi:conserved hypothetical protein [Sphingomonas sp. EC-HK361]|uniref:hypothetical protein n=1 Tax=Sphingomonas sp. EC-HK361 TaxID=2038397 RepID=UPI00125C52CB|nr:hypothetical protein [Sphingomonas sp. EC-HK361]VVT16749.1 conserved hypothetical protein [Sphingomonas sp. EC-HK361]
MIGLLMLLAQVGSPAVTEKPIVVTARRLDDTRRALDACLARKCPPSEDIDTSLAHAENQFLAGDYEAARTTLLASRRRNARFAKTLPVPVSDLSRANARMAALVGMPDVARVNTIEALDALKAGLPSNDARVLSQRLEIGDVFARQGRLTAATDMYDDVAKRARDAGQPLIQGYAMLRKAVLYGAMASIDSAYRQAAQRAIRAIENADGTGLEPFKDGVKLLKARLAVFDGDTKAIDAALASMQKVSTKAPILVFAPPIAADERGRIDGTKMSSLQIRGSDNAQWADVSFWVAPDGTVRDIDVMRQSDTLDPTWLERATKALAGRRYQPMAMAPGSPGLLRVERYSYVWDRASETGTRIATRVSTGHVEILDLTVAPEQPPGTPSKG